METSIDKDDMSIVYEYIPNKIRGGSAVRGVGAPPPHPHHTHNFQP